MRGDPVVANTKAIDVGDWIGRAIEYIRDKDEETYQGWRAGTSAPPSGEDWSDFSDRLAGVIAGEISTVCQNLLVLCQGGFIRAILQCYLGLDPAHASLSAFRLENGKPPRLEFFNDLHKSLDFGAPN